MYTHRFLRILTLFLVVCLVFLFIALPPPFHVHARSSSMLHAARPTISTSCPSPGTARAAFMPPLTLGTHPTIVYRVNEFSHTTPTLGTLNRDDVVTGGKVDIVKLAKTTISEAQVSADGQWSMFVAQVSGQNKLQLVRMDGRFLQTLYCGNPSHVQWSTNQQLAVFEDAQGVYLLNVASGVVQLELTVRGAPPGISNAHPRTWLDTTRVYVTLEGTDAPPEMLAILDTSKGPNQKVQSLQQVFDANTSNPFCWDFDSSFDATKLFVSQCTNGPANGPGGGPAHGPSVITVRPPTGGPYTYLYVNQDQAFTAVRAVTSNTLLFTVDNASGGTSPNGLWKVNTDGTGPLRLAIVGVGVSGVGDVNLCPFTQFPWSNVSRDGKMYALQINHTGGTAPQKPVDLVFGSLSSSEQPTIFESSSNAGIELAVVGWTTM